MAPDDERAGNLRGAGGGGRAVILGAESLKKLY